MRFMFHSVLTVSSFNSDLSNWDVSSVTNMASMFHSASLFEGDLSKWDVSSVTNMANMFHSASAFNSDLSKWEVFSVTDMSFMFQSASSFNGDLLKWDVSSVTTMVNMFNGASSFKQTLCRGAWLISKADKDGMFDGSSGRICRKTASNLSVTCTSQQLSLCLITLDGRLTSTFP